MTTPPQIVAMLNWQRAHAGELAYSQTDRRRLSSDAEDMTSPTDCSGLIARLYAHFAGLNVGTYTGNERNFGELVTTSRAKAAAGEGMLPGDAVFFNWSGPHPTFDHVAMYAGDGRIWNHGGPGRGPNDWSLRDNVNNATEVMVRRFLAPTTHNAPQEFHVNEADANLIRKIVREELTSRATAGVHVNGFLDSKGKRYTIENFLYGIPGYRNVATRVAAAAKKAAKR